MEYYIYNTRLKGYKKSQKYFNEYTTKESDKAIFKSKTEAKNALTDKNDEIKPIKQ